MKSKAVKVSAPNGVVYFIVYLLIYPLLKLCFRLKVDRSDYRMPKGPFIVVSNHTSFMDFLLVMLAVYPRRLNAIAAQKFFYYRPLNWLLPLMGCIPKNLFDTDTRPIRGIAEVIKRGGGVLIFPEARCSTDGAYMGMHTTTGKLFKKLGVPIVACRIDGAYVSVPFWRKGFRLGTERLTFTNLLSPEDLQELSADDINRRMDEYLSGVHTLPPKEAFHVYKEKLLAEGLQNILYYCPKCGSEFTTETAGNKIYCTACGNAASMNRYARLTPTAGSIAPETVHKWFKEQTAYEMRAFLANIDQMHTKVSVRMPGKPGEGLEQCGQGEIRLDSEGWHYSGILRGEETEVFFPLQSVPALPFDPNDNFQIYSNGNFYVFTPENTRACVKYAILGECAYRHFVSPIHMTDGYDSGFNVQGAESK
jgi:1-acyl-sn-glycerol-3-phosphate acyltransferase